MRIFATGSSDGLGRETARQLVEAGHDVVLHARSTARAVEARDGVPGARDVLVADLGSLDEVRRLAGEAVGFDGVVHNAGLYRGPRTVTADGYERILQVNVLAPYLLTALMPRPRRWVILSSGLHQGGTPDLTDPAWERRPWSADRAYADSKLAAVVLAFALARRWPEVRANAVNPGWVATKMGGSSAPDDLHAGGDTQAWLAAGGTEVSGAYWRYREQEEPSGVVRDVAVQDAFLARCAELTGVALPT